MDIHSLASLTKICKQESLVSSILSFLHLDELLEFIPIIEGEDYSLTSEENVRCVLNNRYSLLPSTSFSEAVKHAALTTPSFKSLDYASPSIVMKECLKEGTNVKLMCHILDTYPDEVKHLCFGTPLSSKIPFEVIKKASETFEEYMEHNKEQIMWDGSSEVIKRVHNELQPFIMDTPTVFYMIYCGKYKTVLELWPNALNVLVNQERGDIFILKMSIRSGDLDALNDVLKRYDPPPECEDEDIILSYSIKMLKHFYPDSDPQKKMGINYLPCISFPPGEEGMEYFRALRVRMNDHCLRCETLLHDLVLNDDAEGIKWLNENGYMDSESIFNSTNASVAYGSENCFRYLWPLIPQDKRDKYWITLFEGYHHEGISYTPNAHIFTTLSNCWDHITETLIAICVSEPNLAVLKLLNLLPHVRMDFIYGKIRPVDSFEFIRVVEYLITQAPPSHATIECITPILGHIPTIAQLLKKL